MHLLIRGQVRGAMKYHLLYWWAKLRNDFLRLCWFGPNESQFVEELMRGLERDSHLRKLLDDARKAE